MNKSKIAFLDRDGVIFESTAEQHRYILKYEQATYTENSEQAIKLLNDMGYKVIVVTNKRCIFTYNEANFIYC